MQPSIIVHIVEDDRQAAASLAAVVRSLDLESEIYGSAEDFLKRADWRRPGFVILDWLLPGMTGTELQEWILKSPQAPPLVFVSGQAGIPVAITALKRGAVTFLEKPCDEAALQDAIRLALQIDRQQRQGRQKQQDAAQRLARLTPRELEVLRHAMAGMPNKQIASRLGVSVRTVELARNRIHEKTETDSIAALVRLAIDSRFLSDPAAEATEATQMPVQ